MDKKKNNFIKLNRQKIDHLPRQKRTSIFREDTGISLASRYKLIKKGIRIGKRTIIEPYTGLEGLLDIHSELDIKLAKKIAKLI